MFQGQGIRLNNHWVIELYCIQKKEGYLEAEMAGDYAGLLKLASNGNPLKISMVAGAGFEPTTFGL